MKEPGQVEDGLEHEGVSAILSQNDTSRGSPMAPDNVLKEESLNMLNGHLVESKEGGAPHHRTIGLIRESMRDILDLVSWKWCQKNFRSSKARE